MRSNNRSSECETRITNDELRIGLNPEMWSVNQFADISKQLSEAGIGVQSTDLIKPIWT